MVVIAIRGIDGDATRGVADIFVRDHGFVSDASPADAPAGRFLVTAEHAVEGAQVVRVVRDGECVRGDGGGGDAYVLRDTGSEEDRVRSVALIVRLAESSRAPSC